MYLTHPVCGVFLESVSLSSWLRPVSDGGCGVFLGSVSLSSWLRPVSDGCVRELSQVEGTSGKFHRSKAEGAQD